MKVYNDVIPEVIANNIGNYIAFGGLGIVDGLKLMRDRSWLYKIISIDDDGLHCKRYGRRKGNVLPPYNFNQGCIIVTQADYKLIPPPRY
jgi:hypothetical protein